MKLQRKKRYRNSIKKRKPEEIITLYYNLNLKYKTSIKLFMENPNPPDIEADRKYINSIEEKF